MNSLSKFPCFGDFSIVYANRHPNFFGFRVLHCPPNARRRQTLVRGAPLLPQRSQPCPRPTPTRAPSASAPTSKTAPTMAARSSSSACVITALVGWKYPKVEATSFPTKQVSPFTVQVRICPNFLFLNTKFCIGKSFSYTSDNYARLKIFFIMFSFSIVFYSYFGR